MSNIPRTYDAVFELNRHGIPLHFLRALAWNESRLNPDRAHDRGSRATGLLQITTAPPSSSVLADYNERNGTDFTAADVRDPQVNVEIGTWHLRQIANAWSRRYGFDVGDFTDRAKVHVLVMAWNAGWSDRNGYGRVARYLRDRGEPITADNLLASVDASGAFRGSSGARFSWASDDALARKARWSGQVAADTMREIGTPAPAVEPDSVAAGAGDTGDTIAAAAVVPGVPVWLLVASALVTIAAGLVALLRGAR